MPDLTIDAAARAVLEDLTPAERTQLETLRREDLGDLHFHPLALAIRNEFAWPGRVEVGPFMHPDEVGGLILARAWEMLRP